MGLISLQLWLAGLKIVKYSDLASFEEFEEIVKKNSERLSCLMVTYPILMVCLMKE